MTEDGTAQLVTITITAQNDVPSIIVLQPSMNFVENSTAKFLVPGAGVTDPDSGDFDGGWLRVRITSGRDAAADSLGIFSQTAGPGLITVVGGVVVDGAEVQYEGIRIGEIAVNGSGTGGFPLFVTLESTATRPAVRTLLRNVTFLTTGDDPSTTDRVIEMAIKDGDGMGFGTATKTVHVIAVNDAPSVLVPQPSMNFEENSEAKFIAPGAGVTDPDSDDFDGGWLRVRITSGRDAAADSLGIFSEPAGPGKITVDGTDVQYEGTSIGTITSDGTGGFPLIVTLNANATRVAVRTLLRNVTFQTTGDDPSTTDREIEMAVKDGDGGLSIGTATKTVHVLAADDKAVIAGTVDPVDYTRGGSSVALNPAPGGTLTDPDSDDLEG